MDVLEPTPPQERVSLWRWLGRAAYYDPVPDHLTEADLRLMKELVEGKPKK